MIQVLIGVVTIATLQPSKDVESLVLLVVLEDISE